MHATLLQLVLLMQFVSNNEMQNEGKILSYQQQQKHLLIKKTES